MDLYVLVLGAIIAGGFFVYSAFKKDPTLRKLKMLAWLCICIGITMDLMIVDQATSYFGGVITLIGTICLFANAILEPQHFLKKLFSEK